MFFNVDLLLQQSANAEDLGKEHGFVFGHCFSQLQIFDRSLCVTRFSHGRQVVPVS